MKKDLISQVEVITPLQRHYDKTGRLPTNAIPDEDSTSWEFNFNSMRMVCIDTQFDKIMSLFGKQIKRNFG